MHEYSSSVASLRGQINEVRYRTIRGEFCGDTEGAAQVTVVLRVNGVPCGETLLAGDSGEFEIISPRDIIGTDLVEIDLRERARVTQTLRWANDARPLPPEWGTEASPKLPSLFVIGTAKSATTSLHVYLDQHPGIFMSKPKEPFFFEAEYERGAAFYYRKYFGGWNGERVVGESRHRNLYLPFVPARIHAFNPHASLIAILRNPSERAVSHWWHWRSRGMEELAPAEAFQCDIDRLHSGKQSSSPAEIGCLDESGRSGDRTYIDTGYYAEQLERYIALFGRNRLHVILFDELVREPRKTVREACRFLDVDPDPVAKINVEPLNQSSPGMWGHVDRRTWDWLGAHYEAHNRRLEALLGRSLEIWRTPHPLLSAKRT
jgi:hypothetical protein